MKNNLQKIFVIVWGLCLSVMSVSGHSEQKCIHENVRTVPYPQEKTPLYINPSALFVPYSLKGEDKLQFALSSDESFPAHSTFLSSPKPWCMYNPHRTLSPGVWFWKYRRVSREGVCAEWSKVYRFVVGEDVPRFVTPPFQTFLSNIPELGNRIYCYLSDSLASARKNVYAHPEFNDMIAQARMGLAFNLSTDTDPYGKVSEMAELSVRLHTAYLLLQRPVYAKKMVQYVRWLLKARLDDKRLENDFFAGDLAFLLANTYETCYTFFTPKERDEIQRLVMQVFRVYRSRLFGHEENHVFDNHFWQFPVRKFMQAALVFYDKEPLAMEYLEYLYEVWTSKAPASGFNRDGNWHNGTSYFSANAVTLYYMASLCSYLTKTDFMSHPWYQNAGKGLVYSWPPRSMSAGFGDGHEKTNDQPLRIRSGFADFLTREKQDVYAAWYSSINQKYETDYEFRLYRMVSGKFRPASSSLPANAPKVVWFQDTGAVIAIDSLADCTRGMYLSFRSSPFGSGSHTHSNQNAFNLHYNGVPVYRSSGYYLNFSDRHNILSYRHTCAHNTLLVDGIGQGFTTKAYGNVTRMLHGEHITYCLGDASHAYGGVSEYPMWQKNFEAAGLEQTPEYGFGKTPLTKYLRHILVLRPGIVVIYDEMEASRKVRWEWLLHSPVRFQIDTSSNTLVTPHPEGGFVSTARLFATETCEISQCNEFQAAPNPDLAIRGETLENYWHLTASFSPRKANRLLTVITLDEESGKSHVVSGGKDGKLTVDGWRISAELDVRKSAALTVENAATGVVFSYGDKDCLIEGETYHRKAKGTTVLYDRINGVWKCEEVADRPALPTTCVEE